MNPARIQLIYDRLARLFDASTRLYPFFGFRFNTYRRIALARLELQPGDHVVDLGCGTGLNFPLIQSLIGPEGRITGVDFSRGMLDRAQRRTDRAGWGNVELVQLDMKDFEVASDVNAVFTSGALGFLEDPDEWIRGMVKQLPQGARLGLLDLKQPDRWPRWLFHLFFSLSGTPFAVTPEYVAHRPWITLASICPATQMSEHYGGAVYIATVKKKGSVI